MSEALDVFLSKNTWILENGFKRENVIAEQVFADELRNNIETIIEYLCNDEEKRYEKEAVKDYIHLVIRKIKSPIV